MMWTLVSLLLTVTSPAATQPVLDPAAMDISVDPCSDLYAYSCGAWMKANPVPGDQSTWNAYAKLHDQNFELLHQILEGEKQGQLHDFWASCMDVAALEKLGSKPLQPWLDRIAALEAKGTTVDPEGLARLLADLQSQGVPDVLFNYGPQQDFRDATKWIAQLDESGLGLPDRDYYLKKDKRSVSLREEYVKVVARLLFLSGDKNAEKNAPLILAFETKLAKASFTNVERTDSKNLDHFMSLDALKKQSKAFPWDTYFAVLGGAAERGANVSSPKFLEAMSKAVETEPVAVWKAFLTWHVAQAIGGTLDKSFRDPLFDFYKRTLRGVKEEKPRWKQCVGAADALLGEALGKTFVEKYFPGEAKARTVDLVTRIIQAMKVRLEKLPWMSPGAREKAVAKLSAMRNNIGYPDKWRDYSSVKIDGSTFANNVTALVAFEVKRQRDKIGHVVERGEWGMTPPTVNAYYDAQLNEMNFPAGVLLPPLFDAFGDSAANYGDTGATVGHELTHGFDSDGRQFDPLGNLNDWWSKEDEKRFKKQTQCVVDQYKEYVIVDDVRINSQLTLGEDIADLGGTIIAYQAYMASDDKAARKDSVPGTFTPAQRFFIAYGQSFCQTSREADMRLRAATDVHSPAKHRVNGVVSNMPEFAQAFSCKAGAPLVRKNVCQIW